MSDHTLLPVALEAVAAAAAITRVAQQARHEFANLTKDDKSPVTVADFAAQAIVSMTLRERIADPRQRLLIGEEDAATLAGPDATLIREGVVRLVRTWRPSAGEADILDAIGDGETEARGGPFWTLDPVDGTKGFLRGQQYAIALAWIEEGMVTVGALGCPALPVDQASPLESPDPEGVIYAASRGGGAWEYPACDPAGTPHRIAASSFQPDRGIRYCGSVEKAHGDRSLSSRVIDSLGGGTPVAVDSQCKYAIVARGQADAYLRLPRSLSYVERIWDHAAGSIIATEAGARVSDMRGRPLEFTHGRGLEANDGIVVAIPDLHDRLIQGIAEEDTPPSKTDR